MKWLVTTESDLDATQLDETLVSAGGRRVDDRSSVPLGADEKVWEVEGPSNLDRKLDGAKAVKDVYPSSAISLY